MKILWIGLLATMSVFAVAEDLNVGFGGSVPKERGALQERSGPSRAGGGEKITVTFKGDRQITNIRLSAFSPSHQGKFLIRSAKGYTSSPRGTIETNLDALSRFDKVTSGAPENYQGMPMVADGKFVENNPNYAFREIEFQIEGFTNNDIGMLIQISTNTQLPMTEFIVHRTGNGEVVGAYVDEVNYAKFSAADIAGLVAASYHPRIDDLANRSFVCSSYSRTARQIDFKTRAYYNTNGALQSASNLDAHLVTWTQTQEGWSLPTDNTNGCGKYVTNNLIRMTASGNLVSEIVLNRYNYLVLCSQAGYDWNAQAAQLDGESYPSVINPDYRALSYEFCRPAVLPN
jgi:hypothetical protein